VARGDVEAEVVEVEVVEVASSSRWHPRRCRRGVVVVIVSSSSLTWRSRPRHRGVVEAGWAGVSAGAVVLAFAGVRAVVVGSVKVGGSSLSSWCRRRP